MDEIIVITVPSAIAHGSYRVSEATGFEQAFAIEFIQQSADFKRQSDTV